MSTKQLHNGVHKVLTYMPEPISGATVGAAGGTIVGAASSVSALHLTVGGVVASVHTVGITTTASIIATAAAPIMLPAIGCCTVFGASYGLYNWAKGGFKNPYS